MFTLIRLSIGIALLAFVAVNVRDIKGRILNHESDPFRPSEIASLDGVLSEIKKATAGTSSVEEVQNIASVSRGRVRYLDTPESASQQSMSTTETMCNFYPDLCR